MGRLSKLLSAFKSVRDDSVQGDLEPGRDKTASKPRRAHSKPAIQGRTGKLDSSVETCRQAHGKPVHSSPCAPTYTTDSCGVYDSYFRREPYPGARGFFSGFYTMTPFAVVPYA